MANKVKVAGVTRIYSAKNLTVKMNITSNLEMRLNNVIDGMQEESDRWWETVIAPYIPFDTGALRRSMFANTVIGSGLIVTKTPYARLRYHKAKEPGTKPSAPLSGPNWYNRAVSDHLPDWGAMMKRKFGVDVE